MKTIVLMLFAFLLPLTVAAQNWSILSSTSEPYACVSTAPKLYYSTHVMYSDALNKCSKLAIKYPNRLYYVRNLSMDVIIVTQDSE